MATYGDIKTRVAGNLVRTDLGTEIGQAINDAINEYASTRFWFNETRSVTFNTVQGQQFYGTSDSSSIPYFVSIEQLILTDNGQRYQILRVTNDELERADQPSTAQGRPYLYAYFNKQIRLWPPPPATVYSIRVTGYLTLAELTDDTQTNVFTENAANLIRLSALRRVYSEIIRDDASAQTMLLAEQAALERLNVETAQRNQYDDFSVQDF